MEFARERFFDGGRDCHVTLSLRSRTPVMHSLLTALTPEEREAVSRVLARALDEIAALVQPHLEQESR